MYSSSIYPLLLKPVYKEYPWGGLRIPAIYNRDYEAAICAESWELADHEDGMSQIANGAWAGKPLREVLERHSREILGDAVEGTRLPILIKLIDAKKKLSAQVHPNKEKALQLGGEAKTEMWHVIGNEPVQVYCGIDPDVSQQRFIGAIHDRSCGKMLTPHAVSHGDSILVEAGQVHSIDAGCLIFEVQQNSNTTYRINDWNRKDAAGNRRDLHIDQAIESIDWKMPRNPRVEMTLTDQTDAYRVHEIIDCAFFKVEKLSIRSEIRVELGGESFHALFITEGSATLSWGSDVLHLPPGSSVLVPVALKSYTLSGQATVLRTSIPTGKK